MQSHPLIERPVPAASPTASDYSQERPSPALAVRGLNKRYKNGTQANINIDLTANAGEILGILGPNGAGKTTLVRQITTELLPTDGDVFVLGHNVVTEPLTVKGLLGVMPQEATLFDYLSVRQHLRIFAKLRGLTSKAAARRADELVDELDLTEYRDVSIVNLSGGLRRRVLVAIAVIADPPVMVLDEPTTALDPQSRRNLWSILRQYRDQGSLVLLTTHSMEEAEALCDRVGIINRGRLMALDSVENLRAEHGFEYKITCVPDGPAAAPITLYGSDSQSLIAKVREQGIQQFSVARTSLEDVYLALIGELEGVDDQPG